MSISIDPGTGLKIFNTRAASTMDDVVGVEEGAPLHDVAGVALDAAQGELGRDSEITLMQRPPQFIPRVSA